MAHWSPGAASRPSALVACGGMSVRRCRRLCALSRKKKVGKGVEASLKQGACCEININLFPLNFLTSRPRVVCHPSGFVRKRQQPPARRRAPACTRPGRLPPGLAAPASTNRRHEPPCLTVAIKSSRLSRRAPNRTNWRGSFGGPTTAVTVRGGAHFAISSSSPPPPAARGVLAGASGSMAASRRCR